MWVNYQNDIIFDVLPYSLHSNPLPNDNLKHKFQFRLNIEK